MKVLKKSELCEEKPTNSPTYGDAYPGNLIIGKEGTRMVIQSSHELLLSSENTRVYYVYLSGPSEVLGRVFHRQRVALLYKNQIVKQEDVSLVLPD